MRAAPWGVSRGTSSPGTWFYSWPLGRGAQIRNLREAVSVAGEEKREGEEEGKEKMEARAMTWTTPRKVVSFVLNCCCSGKSALYYLVGLSK
jgi:hypothetical protein